LNDQLREQLIEILKAIQRPEGVYRLDPVEYRNNVIVYCVRKAEEGLDLLNVEYEKSTLKEDRDTTLEE